MPLPYCSVLSKLPHKLKFVIMRCIGDLMAVLTGKVPESLKKARKSAKKSLTFGVSGAKIIGPHRRGLSWHAQNRPRLKSETTKMK